MRLVIAIGLAALAACNTTPEGNDGPQTSSLGVSSVGLGWGHSCALLDDGRVKCWGNATEGELGLGDTEVRGDGPGEMAGNLPFVSLGPGGAAVSVLAGDFHTCALLDNSQVKCWGDNGSGQLGLGDTASRAATPDTIPAHLLGVDLGTNVTAVQLASGATHMCVLSSAGQVKCWGDNYFGQLGLGDASNHGDESAEMGDDLPAVDLGSDGNGQPLVAAAIDAGDVQTCALLQGGQVKCWGSNFWGELGIGDNTNRGDEPGEMGDDLPPVDLGTGRSAVQIAVADAHACALLDDGTVKCWGHNAHGNLGLGDTEQRGDEPGEMGDALPAVDLGSSASIERLVAGGYHTCALLSDDTVKCWGHNDFGDLGLGDAANRGDEAGEMGTNLPPVDLGTSVEPVDITAGKYHSCVLVYDGEIKCWGENGSGRLGLGDTENRGDDPGEMGGELPFVRVN